MSRIVKWITTALENDDSRSKWRRFLGLAVILGVIAIVLQAGIQNRSGISAAAILAGASLFVGILGGFLFGIPKTVQRKVDSATTPTLAVGDYQPNTNLEDISDWLTKMLIGIGLVQLKEVPNLIDRIAGYWEPSLSVPYAKAYAAGLIVYFSTIGFLIGYLWTRLALIGDFIEKDPRRLINEILNRVARSAQENPEATDRSPERQVVTPQELDAAQKVASLSAESRVSVDDLRQEVHALAAQYEATRASMNSGPERTRRMEVIASQMRTISLAAYSLLSELVQSNSPGKWLAAITFLQTQPNLEPRYLDWLAERLRPGEKPFIGYHAAIALKHAARVAKPEQEEDVGRAIEQALSYAERLAESADRVKVLRSALAILKNYKPTAQ
jgi:polyhydroxyalkanoate synthesis regulator phasin